jgi:hypothetical protein
LAFPCGHNLTDRKYGIYFFIEDTAGHSDHGGRKIALNLIGLIGLIGRTFSGRDDCHEFSSFGGIVKMVTLVVGFVGMVLVPALILSLILTRLNKTSTELPLHEDNLKFRISSGTK